MTSTTLRSSPSPPPPAKRQRFETDGSKQQPEQQQVPASAEQQEQPVAGPSGARLDYHNKAFLAPMVRSGTLPARLLSLQYGADLVWGPEVVDRAIIGCDRTVDDRTGLITYSKKGKRQWWTHPVEKDQLIFQIGTADPELAVQAALTVERDVAGVDLNCGCPKPFSTHNGAGAGLLTTPDKLIAILTGLVGALSVPVSCKIRLLPDQAETLALVERICQTGIQNLTVHARTKTMRSTERALIERLSDIVEVATRYGIPVAANGDVTGMWDFEKIKKMTGVSSIMIARAAESNASCFLPDKPLDTTTAVIPQLVRYAAHFDNPFGNTKFLINNYAPSPFGTAILSKQVTKDVRSRAATCKDYGALGRAFDFVPAVGADGLPTLVPANLGTPKAAAVVEVTEEEAAMNAGGGGGGVGGEVTSSSESHPASRQPTAEVLAPVVEGIARRYAQREAGLWALGGEQERREHAVAARSAEEEAAASAAAAAATVPPSESTPAPLESM